MSSSPITVRFSTGTTLNVPAGKTVASGGRNWTGGNASGGSTTTPPPTATPTATASPTATSAPVTGGTRYLRADGTLGASGSGGTVSVVAANGQYNGTPHAARTFTASGLNLSYTGAAPTFDLFVDAGSAVGNAVQLRVSYDLTGNGSWERVETYRYFATNDLVGYEHYTQNSGLLSASGTLGNLASGTVKLEVWNAIGNQPTTLGVGNQSVIKLPFF